MILIVGASGLLGRATASRLLDAGHRVRLLVRNPAKAADLAQRGAEVVPGDLIDPASLERGGNGASAVFSAAHALFGRGRHSSAAVDGQGQRALIDAARAAGVQRFVFTSALGASDDHPVDFFRFKAQAEAHLKASGLAWTILRPSAFMEQHVHLFNGLGLLVKGRAQLIGPGTKPRNFVAAGDVAQVAARALTDPALAGRTIAIGGPENLSNLQVTAIYARLAGLPLKTSHLPLPLARALGLLLRPLNPGLARVMQLATLDEAAFPEHFDAAPLAAEFGLVLTSVEQFVRMKLAERAPALVGGHGPG